MTDAAPAPNELDADNPMALLLVQEETLDALRAHDERVPQWELCEGFLTALLCTRREVPESEWLPTLLGPGAGGPHAPFESEGQRTRFMMHLWQRQSQLRQALEKQEEDLGSPDAPRPAVLDWRALAHLEPEFVKGDDIPSLGQLWALGFMTVVDLWWEDWQPPRDPEIAEAMADALDCIEALTADDTARASFNTLDENAPPSVSESRLLALDEAIYAVYDLYSIARALGPRRLPATRSTHAGRNDPCPCGSGKKYKKCCGA